MSNDNKTSKNVIHFGEVTEVSLGRIGKLVAKNMAESWSQIPHVTHHDEVDVDALRRLSAESKGTTILGFVIKAVCETLKDFTEFNASLNNEIDALIIKKFYKFLIHFIFSCIIWD